MRQNLTMLAVSLGRTGRNGSALVFFGGLILLLWLLVPAVASAQASGEPLDRLMVELWPDYDRPSVLVLMTGTLPPETPLPATIILPLPAEAELNAVARISEVDGMVDDIPYAVEDGQLSLTTPDPRFRVEYYVPYQRDGNERTAQFDWTADFGVEAFQLRIQVPFYADELATTAEPETITVAGGLQYYQFPGQALAPDERYTVQFAYELSPDQLSVAGLSAGETAETDAGLPSGPLLALIGAAGVLLGAGAVWLILNRREQRRPVRKPRPLRNQGSSPATVKYCHQCGHAIQPGDRFCRACGTALKHNR